ncbi:transmembrane protein 128 isoform X3 [Cyclopterus lumpus]|uniref:transmembrane protein 128 isoform X3 n=1 Tax=Cyclopterus lumpus TaxID=8103 RepID=UPI001487278E|nr:transmembrane protein 128 isoform X3 [Cyclopterus lumpus]
MLNDSELATLRNRFKRDAEFLLQTTGSGDEEEAENKKSQEEKDAKPLPRINRHSLFWIVASIGVTYYVDFLHNIMENDDIKSWWFNVGLMLLGVCLSLAMFCIVYLEWFKGIQHYDQEYPAVPPLTTAAFIAASCREFGLKSHKGAQNCCSKVHISLKLTQRASKHKKTVFAILATYELG